MNVSFTSETLQLRQFWLLVREFVDYEQIVGFGSLSLCISMMHAACYSWEIYVKMSLNMRENFLFCIMFSQHFCIYNFILWYEYISIPKAES